MNTIMIVGLLLFLTGVALALFAKLQVVMGLKGIAIIVALMGVGLLMLLPAKIYLTLILMKAKDTTEQ